MLKPSLLKISMCTVCVILAVSCVFLLISDDSYGDNEQRVKVDGIYYVLNDSDSIAAVVNPDRPSEYSRTVTVPGTITYTDSSTGENKEYTVAIIGLRAFRDTWVQRVVLPDTIEDIQTQAFHGCTQLGYVNIPANLKTIGAEAFYNCINLQFDEISFPASVRSIGRLAFYVDDIALKKVSFEGTETHLGDYAFYGDCSSMIADGTKDTAKTGAFYCFDNKWMQINGKCGENLTWEYDIESKMISVIGTGAMDDYDSNSLLPWRDLFDKILSVFIGKDMANVTSVGANAFCGCASLENLALGTNVTSVGADAFGNCPNLLYIAIDNGTKFDNDPFPGYVFYDGENIIEYTSEDFRGKSYYGESKDKMIKLDEKQHAVLYDLDGGSGEVPKQKPVTEEFTFKVASYSGEKEGFAFGGWKDENEKIYQPGDIMMMGTKDIILTAVWNESPQPPPGPTPTPPEPIPPEPTPEPIPVTDMDEGIAEMAFIGASAVFAIALLVVAFIIRKR